MSTVKITQLPLITSLNANTAQTVFLAVDVPTDTTGRFTGTTLAQGLYSHNVLNVGNNAVVLPNTVAQFAGSSDNYLQVNLQNNSGNGSADFVITANNGTDTTYYIDLGLNGSSFNYPGYTYAKALDGYLVVQGDMANTPGGNLVIGTTVPNKNVSILLGSADANGISAEFIYNTGFKLRNLPIIFGNDTIQNTAAAPFAVTNASFLQANSAFAAQNTTGNYANSAFTKANSSFVTANSAAAFANAAGDTAATAVINAGIADSKAVTAGNYANSAFSKANSAYATANAALANTTGTFAGDLTVTGNVIVKYAMQIVKPDTPGNGVYLLVNGSNTGSYGIPSNPGYTLLTVGPDGQDNRIVGESYSNTASDYVSFIGRRARGTSASPLPVANNDIIARFGGNAYGATKFSQYADGRIEIVANGNHTDTSKPTRIRFMTTAVGTNNVTEIASFNGDTASFSGALIPSKGFVFSPRVPGGNQTAITVNYDTDSIIKANLAADLAITHTNYIAGKVVEVWLVNVDNSNHTVTHGCAALRSTNKSTTATITAGSSMLLKFFSIDGDNANTFVSIIG